MSENLIEWLKLLLLALVQGFTEILPISSSGHILVLENLMGLNTSLTFSVFLSFFIEKSKTYAFLFFLIFLKRTEKSKQQKIFISSFY